MRAPVAPVVPPGPFGVVVRDPQRRELGVKSARLVGQPIFGPAIHEQRRERPTGSAQPPRQACRVPRRPRSGVAPEGPPDGPPRPTPAGAEGVHRNRIARRRHERMRPRVQRRQHPGVARGGGEEVGVRQRQRDRPVAAHRQARDTAMTPVGAGAVDRVHVRHEVVGDVGGVPAAFRAVRGAAAGQRRVRHARRVAGRLDPVGIPAVVAVRHHHDDLRCPRREHRVGDPVELDEGRPIRFVTAVPVQVVRHGVAPGPTRVRRWQINHVMLGHAEGRGVERLDAQLAMGRRRRARRLGDERDAEHSHEREDGPHRGATP